MSDQPAKDKRDRIVHAIRVVAQLCQENPQYLPLLRRLDAELKQIDADAELLARYLP